MVGLIERKPEEAARVSHDLIVVGGGVYGTALALEAARRGLRPLLLEREDFGARTSWNSLRIVHGGLRYLQDLDIKRFRESVGERRWFLRNFPDLVHPLRCLMPLYGDGLRRPSVLRCALLVNDLLSARRNAGVAEKSRLGRGRVLGLEEILALYPGVRRERLRGAAFWQDAAMPLSQRLLMEMLRWAAACGATSLNYVAARSLTLEGGRVSGVEAEDRETGASLRFRSPVVVNCAGPWSRGLAERFDRDLPPLFRPSLAMNVYLAREPVADLALAVAPPVRGARTYFLYPWEGGVFAGTYHAPLRRGEEEGRPWERHLAEFLSDLNAAVPGLEAAEDRVLRVHWGLLPAAEEGTERLAVREVILDHGRRGGPAGLVSVSGVKFTTARLVAEKTLRLVAALEGKSLPPRGAFPRPAAQALPDGEAFRRMIREDRPAARTLVERLRREESSLHLDDLLLRRTAWGTDPRRAEVLGGEVCDLAGWTGERAERETRRLEGTPTTV